MVGDALAYFVHVKVTHSYLGLTRKVGTID